MYVGRPGFTGRREGGTHTHRPEATTLGGGLRKENKAYDFLVGWSSAMVRKAGSNEADVAEARCREKEGKGGYGENGPIYGHTKEMCRNLEPEKAKRSSHLRSTGKLVGGGAGKQAKKICEEWGK